MNNHTQTLLSQLNDAVSVIVLSPEIRKFLTVVDPKALDQCFAAFNAYRNHFSEWSPCAVQPEDFQ
jgi:hypothetical protein